MDVHLSFLDVVAQIPADQITPSERLVLLAVARRCGTTEGICFSSQENLAALAGVSDRTVRRSILGLVEAGLLVRGAMEGRTGLLLHPDILSGSEDNPSGQPDILSGRRQAKLSASPDISSGPPDILSADPDILSTEEPLRPPEDPLKPPGLEDAPTLVVRGRREADPDDPKQEAVAALLELQQEAGHWADKPDRSRVEALLKDHDPEVLRMMWAAVAENDWWKGTNSEGQPRLRWRSVGRVGPGLDKRIAEATVALDAQDRQRRRYRVEPHPDPATLKIRPPPSRSPRER